MNKAKVGLTFLLFFAANGLIAQKGQWVDLFNGKDLSGWKILGGEGEYKIKGNEIVGLTKGRANTFLATEKAYGDFVLELEVWVDFRMNSGIQFRSAQNESGRVFGYQAEIDPSVRAYSGGLYDEGRRDWLYPLSLNDKGRRAFKGGKWNKYRIEAVGSSIRIWVNDMCTAYVEDDVSPSGFIALQVHGVGTEEEWGRKVKWRNIRIKTSGLKKELKDVPEKIYQLNLLKNKLTTREKRSGWKLLWNGESPSGWRKVHGNKFPSSRWEMKDGELSVLASDKEGNSDGQDIITNKQYSNFELSWQYKLTEGANSGVKYLVNEELNPEGGAIGLEFQLLDNNKHPDAKMGKNGNRTQSSLYDLIPAENLSYAGMGKRFLRGIGQWNHARLIVNGNHVEHWLNGFKVVEYTRNTPLFNEMVKKSKYKDWPNFGNEAKGHIVLQDHGNRVTFRSIKIRKL